MLKALIAYWTYIFCVKILLILEIQFSIESLFEVLIKIKYLNIIFTYTCTCTASKGL